MTQSYGESVNMSATGKSELIGLGVNANGDRFILDVNENIVRIGDSTTGDNIRWLVSPGASIWQDPAPPGTTITIPPLEEPPFGYTDDEILKILDQKAKEMMELAGVGEKSPILGPNGTEVRKPAPAKELPVQEPPPKRRIDVED